MRKKLYLYAFYALILLGSCEEKKPQQELTPWGTPIGEVEGMSDGEEEGAEEAANKNTRQKGFSLEDIQENGELIMLTVNGPTTYYDYHNHGMGLQYLLCEKFAQQIGVSLRVEECKDTTEMIQKLTKGEGDIIAVPLSRKQTKGDLLFCGVTPDSTRTQWAVVGGNKSLADTLNGWFKPKMIAETKKEENWLLSSASVTRHVYSPFLNRSKGVISRYDHLFQRYSGTARMDWRLMAAQCYQESCFDPNAKSWAGACGLMQIMPSTADHLGLPMSAIHDAESNVAAAAKYMAELQGHFSDIGDPTQRVLFALAAYNGGFHHIRDAMNLTRKHGGNPYNWGHVREYVLRLAQPAYYHDPVVKYGFMRGTETADYVDRIRARWSEYCGGASFHDSYRGGSRGIGGGAFHGAPMKSKRHYQGKYHI
ncbi:transglycosylase SLT domain-containing protein [Prevotella copri]|uniref:Transglycosylase SLT domain-containing protein n=1 Tax=Segatella copri TaxID=165179 RepID=A0A6G1TX30_9BACT|nr:transglycosylase SLT domain-containing protein [Segatella copri]MQN79445.1 transglycosylase SLT domain-containing protein [Segatella copri]